MMQKSAKNTVCNWCDAPATHEHTENGWTDYACEAHGRQYWPQEFVAVSLKKWYAIAATADGRWGVEQAPGVFVFVSDYRNGIGTLQCRRWRLRKANGFNL